MSARRVRLSTLRGLPVVDAGGARMTLLDVRTSAVTPPQAPEVVGLLCSPVPSLAYLGLKRPDAAATLARRRVREQSRFVPWRCITAIEADAVRLACRFDELPLLGDAPDPGTGS